MNTRHFLAFFLALAVTAAFADDAKDKHVNATEAAALVKAKKVTVIDVRSADEYANGHIEGAKNLDILQEKTFEPELAKLDKATPVLVHCAAGGRSTRSLKTFQKLGFKDVTHLDGGLNGWVAAGLPVKK